MGRPKGYADWNPRPETLALVENVNSVLQEYRAHLPLTVRQIFYRLVGAYGYEKTEKAYQRLIEALVRARRAQMIPFKAIRDDGTAGEGPRGIYHGVGNFWDSIRYYAENYERNRLEDQGFRIEVWCEAAGMIPQLERVAFDYTIPVYSTGGFSSVTVTKEIADRVVRGGQNMYFLHIGDYDPSGQSIYEAMSEDARQFVWAHSRSVDLIPQRVALTPEQVDEHNLPTAPAKSSDSRSVNWYDETCQAEAMPPDILAQTLRDAIEELVDSTKYNAMLSKEEDDRGKILETLDEIRDEYGTETEDDEDE